MLVGVLCEFSGIVRDAFTAKGHEAISCDILHSEQPGEHLVGDCLKFDWSGCDLIIAHPPCTHLAVSGSRWFGEKKEKQERALEFVRRIMELPVPRICVENPVSVISTRIRKPEQIIHPWMFGHGVTKSTCLWLKGLPPLTPTKIVEERRDEIHRAAPSPERWKLRSRTFTGIARAMAQQWGSLSTD